MIAMILIMMIFMMSTIDDYRTIMKYQMMSFEEQFNEKLDFCYFFIHVYTVPSLS